MKSKNFNKFSLIMVKEECLKVITDDVYDKMIEEI